MEGKGYWKYEVITVKARRGTNLAYDIESLSEKKNNHYKNWIPVGGISFLDNGGDYIFLTQSIKKWIHIVTFIKGKKREIDEDKLDPHIWGSNPLTWLRQMDTSEVKEKDDTDDEFCGYCLEDEDDCRCLWCDYCLAHEDDCECVRCDDCFEHEDDCKCGTNVD